MSRGDVFDRVLASLHAAVLDDAHWPACSALIDDACRTRGNILSFARGQSQDEAEIYLARLYTRGERHYALEREYFDIYYPQDEKIPRLFRLPDSEVVHITSLYTEEELKTSATYNECLPNSGFQNSVHVRMDGPGGTRIAWLSGDPVDGEGWSFAQTAFIQDLLPHLRHYVLVRQALGDAGAKEASLTGLLDTTGLGIVYLDGRGQIVTTNDRGRKILRKGEALFDQGGYLRARLPADDAAFQAALARALPGRGEQGASGSLAIRRPNDLPGLTVHINPVGDGEIDFRPWRVAALVLVVDPYVQLPVDRALVQAALNLSPAESRVAVLLAEGNTVREVAEATGRSVNTIRWHIRQIFEKHGLSRLGQLVQLVRSLAGHSGTR